MEQAKHHSVIKITSDADELIHGLFGQGLTWVLECLSTPGNDNVMPSHTMWDINANAYGKIVPRVLLPLESTPINDLVQDDLVIHKMVDLKNRSADPFAPEAESFTQAHDLLNRWF